MNNYSKFKVSKLLLWSFCGFVCWTYAHVVSIFLKGRLWLAGGPAMIAGSVFGLLAYLIYISKVGDGLSSKIAYDHVNKIIFVCSTFAGGVLGWIYALTYRTGGTLSYLLLPPSPMIGARLTNTAVCGTLGLIASAIMMFLLKKIGYRPWVLLAYLLSALVLLIVFFCFVLWLTS